MWVAVKSQLFLQSLHLFWFRRWDLNTLGSTTIFISPPPKNNEEVFLGTVEIRRHIDCSWSFHKSLWSNHGEHGSVLTTFYLQRLIHFIPFCSLCCASLKEKSKSKGPLGFLLLQRNFPGRSQHNFHMGEMKIYPQGTDTRVKRSTRNFSKFEEISLYMWLQKHLILIQQFLHLNEVIYLTQSPAMTHSTLSLHSTSWSLFP